MEAPVIAVAILILAILVVYRPVTVQEHQRVVLFRRGRFTKVLEPGQYRMFAPSIRRVSVDIRRRLKTIPAQELLTSDGIGVKATIVLEYEVTDPHASIAKVENNEAALYLAAQLALRDIVSSRTFDQLMEQRPELGTLLLGAFQAPALEIGVTAHRLEIKDVMLPGDLKRIYAQVAEAKQQGLASLERARAQAATNRSLANAAKMLEENPGLWKMRVLDAMEQANGNTFVIGAEKDAGAQTGN